MLHRSITNHGNRVGILFLEEKELLSPYNFSHNTIPCMHVQWISMQVER
jgi:hypothetical protein